MSDRSHGSNRTSDRWAILSRIVAAPAALITVGALPLASRLFSDLAPGHRWISLALVASASLALGAAGFQLAARQSARHSASKHSVELLQEFYAIEKTARHVMPNAESASPIRIRFYFTREGAWTDADVSDFDNAVRVRNAVVHGDAKEVNEASLEDALMTVRRLRKKLQAAHMD
jgi:hypothetical protein